MIDIKIDGSDLKNIETSLKSMKKQIPFATALAITKIAEQVKLDQKKSIISIFDRPTRFTQNSIFMEKATKTKLSSQVWLKDLETPRFQHYLEPQIYGGTRHRKGLEKLLNMKGHTSLPFLTPASGARRTASGNVSAGQSNQILSALGAQRDSLANSTVRSKARNKAKRKNSFNNNYFVIKRKGRGLVPGVYQRTKKGRGVKPIYISVSNANYSRRYDFFGIANKSIQGNAPRLVSEAIQRVINTAWR